MALRRSGSTRSDWRTTGPSQSRPSAAQVGELPLLVLRRATRPGRGPPPAAGTAPPAERANSHASSAVRRLPRCSAPGRAGCEAAVQISGRRQVRARLDAEAAPELLELRRRAPSGPGAARPRSPGPRPSAPCSRCCRRSRGSHRPPRRQSAARRGVAASSAACPPPGARRRPPPGSAWAPRSATGSCARFHSHASCSIVRPWRSAIGRMPLHARAALLHPARRPEAAVVAAGELVPGRHVVVEQAAVVRHAGDDAARPRGRAARGRARPAMARAG